jgi:hypothetical protein
MASQSLSSKDFEGLKPSSFICKDLILFSSLSIQITPCPTFAKHSAEVLYYTPRANDYKFHFII